ncbi:hemolysin III family protein [Brevibacterium daeguense]|uniref:Hemolysin III family protein n=1 Tax=Brevibacterium daeguense TaxID=909936 RepID=A0ABP8EN58_9MICO|nr:hemolysin III family protein [Brevibacterium daeguense]
MEPSTETGPEAVRPARAPKRDLHSSRRGRALRLELSRLAGQLKPTWRGWIHAGAFPLAVVGGLALIILAPTIASRLAAAVFTLTGMMLFGTSAIYHRGRWRTKVRLLLRRIDHANIFLIIAGTYTPLAVMMLDRSDAVVLLTIMWVGAALGVVFRLVWTTAPRWLFVPVYIGIGIAGVGYIPQIWQADLAVGILVVVGGALYITGAVVYGIKRPDPAPSVFGFHEIFHTFTVLGFGSHLAALIVAAVTINPEL